MSKFFIPFDVPISSFNVKHGDQLLFLGSCFSDEMSRKSVYYGFNVLSNPFGTIFHPEVIARNLNDALNGHDDAHRILKRNDLFFSWDASGTVFGYSQKEVTEKINSQKIILKNAILQSKVLFITFGTAWGYRLNETGLLVANCHKVNGSSFTKELTDVDALENSWIQTIELIQRLNPALNIVFTVSPVRHIKDGLIENNQSKSILIELVRRLKAKQSISYFPSYEIIIDELRDYRFYKKDLVHPSEEAIDYIWDKFQSCYFSSETITLNKTIERYRLAEHHKSLYENSQDYIQFKLKIEKEKEVFLKQNNEVIW